MTTAVAPAPNTTDIERVLVSGDLAQLNPQQRLAYYQTLCESLGLNPLTKPFAYITLNGKLTLYALKDATEQLRKLHGVSITSITTQRIDDVFVVTASAQDRANRTDVSTGAVPVGNLKGEALANALMKAETKAKRRVTLSICGLGMLDETEAESIGARADVATVRPLPLIEQKGDDTIDTKTGEVLDSLAPGTYITECRPNVGSGKLVGTLTLTTIPDNQTIEMKVWEQPLYALAEAICQEHTPVTYIAKKSDRWGLSLQELHRAVPAPAPAPDVEPPPLTDDDIPF